MKFVFSEKKISETELIADWQAYAIKKVSKLDRFFKAEADASVSFRSERGKYLAEITVHTNDLIYRASSPASDMHISIDSGVSAIENQIRRNKTKLSKKLREGAVLEFSASPEPEESSEEEFEIIKRKNFTIKPMFADEAILQMNLLEHDFFVFKDAANADAFSVVYRRKQGGYGLISDT